MNAPTILQEGNGGSPYKKKRSNQNRLLRKFNVKLHFVCKGSFKPDVRNIHSKEQSLFLA